MKSWISPKNHVPRRITREHGYKRRDTCYRKRRSRTCFSEQEETMRTLRKLFKFKGTACSLTVGLLLAGLLGGCTEPFVNVAVQVDTTCQAGGMGRPIVDPPPPGACTAPYVSWAGKSADGFWNSQTGLQIPGGSGLTCASGSVKCQSTNPGTCTMVPCKSWYRPSNQSCSCACIQPAP